MLVTQQPVLKRFWYPVMPVDHLVAQPQPFQLLGQPLVLWLDADGQPVVVTDRYCHRSAQLPQAEDPVYRWAIRYGYVWVCLADDPLLPIPHIPEAEDPQMRLIPQFYEPWHCSGLRLMENSFDNAHFSFVHANSFGNLQQPQPAASELTLLEYGLQVRSTVPVVNPPNQRQNLKIADEMTLRHVVSTWYMPFSRTLKITYPNGLMHLIYTAATPVQDDISQVVQFCVRNDTEADAKAADIVAFDRQVTEEDKLVLETTDWDTPLDIHAEQHMPSDQPGIMMRRKLAALLKAHGEVEQRLP
ncbi:MAG: Rieske (2Fe-2S) protein [Elainella sp. Prado103]|jgi:phenylpropionate dioxygenase-like ring-hydroxylating dioxygenase large terminal subunit|nr:Rieske (2Fe-2S) protein [Elainella sp. Prado103]